MSHAWISAGRLLASTGLCSVTNLEDTDRKHLAVPLKTILGCSRAVWLEKKLHFLVICRSQWFCSLDSQDFCYLMEYLSRDFIPPAAQSPHSGVQWALVFYYSRNAIFCPAGKRYFFLVHRALHPSLTRLNRSQSHFQHATKAALHKMKKLTAPRVERPSNVEYSRLPSKRGKINKSNEGTSDISLWTLFHQLCGLE